MTGADRSRWWRLGACTALAAGLLTAGTLAQDRIQVPAVVLGGPGAVLAGGPDEGIAPSALVTSAALACAGPPAGSGSPAGVLAALHPAAPAGAGEAHLTRTRQGSAAGPAAGQLDLSSAPAALDLQPGTGALVAATGGAAPGVVAGQLDLAEEPGARWASLTACPAPAADQWLVGGGGAAGRTEDLVLVNPGTDPVTVDVQVWGSEGPVELTGATGLVVPAGSRVSHLVDGFAEGVGAPVVRVTSTGGGAVSAQLVDTWRSGTTDLGAEVVDPVAPPGTDLVVPAPPRADDPATDGEQDGSLTLRLLAPADEPALVEVTALTREGELALPDHVTSVPAGVVVEVPLHGLPAGPVALRLRSDVPVTGAVAAVHRPGDDEPVVVDPAGEDGSEDDAAEDEAATTAGPTRTEPLIHPAGDLVWSGATHLATTPIGLALPDRAQVPGATTTLALTVLQPVPVEVTWLDERGRARTEELTDLRPDSTTLVEVPDGARAVWVTPQLDPGADDEEGTGGAGGSPRPGVGVAAAVHLLGADARGPYAAMAGLTATPWLRTVAGVEVVRP